MKTLIRLFSLALCLSLTASLAAQDRPTPPPPPPPPPFLAPVEAETAPVLPSGPVTRIELAESSFDFGEIPEGTIVTHVFSFTNTGEEPLIILDAKGSCGCTVPQFPRVPIAPGETASITVQFNSRNKRGRRNQKVTLTANTEPAQTFFYLTGLVQEGDEQDGEIVAPIPEETTVPKDCFAIYPNPTAEVLKLEMTAENLGKSAEISLYSQKGQLMARRSIPRIEGTVEFRVDHYPPGTYVANVRIGDARPETRCFVVVE